MLAAQTKGVTAVTVFSTVAEGRSKSAAELDLDAHQTALLLTEDLSQFRGLVCLDITVERDLQATVLKLCAALPGLSRLRIRGSRLRVGTLPHQISALSALTELTVIGCGLHTLPPTFGELATLRRLTLSGHLFSTFPTELTTLTGLVELRLPNAGRYADLPADLARLTGLRVLDLSGGDFTDLGPIEALPALASLTLDRCRGIRDLTGLRGLPLRQLRMQSNPSLRTVAPLREVETLESLDIRHCDEIADVHTLFDHPRLAEVLGSDAVSRLWERRAELVDLPEIGDIRDVLRAAGSAAAVDQALIDVTRLAIATQGERSSTNRLAALFNVDTDNAGPAVGQLVAIDELTEVLARFGSGLRGSTLIGLVRASYASHRHHLDVTLLALAELVRRGDEATQMEFIEILEAAHVYYDAGHRGFDGDVYDALIDDILPGFRPVPLANLLIRFGTYDYLILDGLGSLLSPALAGPLPDALRTELLDLLRSEATEPGYGLDQWTELVGQLSTEDLPTPVIDALAEIRLTQRELAAVTPVVAPRADPPADRLVDGPRPTALTLTRAYAGVIDPLGHSERVREAIVSMALMSAIANDDDDLARVVVSWVPANINLPNLAFNLACYHATHGGGEPLYDAVRHARRLGKPREQFLADADFATVRDDPGFRRALGPLEVIHRADIGR
jgi:hypothetical protein